MEASRRRSLVQRLLALHGEGARPSRMVSFLVDEGAVGVQVINLMQEAFGLQLSQTKAINAWLGSNCEGTPDDEKLDRYLGPRLPGKPR